MTGCRICNKRGKVACMFCDYRPKKRKDMTDMEIIKMEAQEEEMRWLVRTRDTLRNLRMASTGSFDTDEKIRKLAGDWGDLSRGTVTFKENDDYGVRLDSGLELRIRANYRDAVVGQRVTVRFFEDGEVKL